MWTTSGTIIINQTQVIGIMSRIVYHNIGTNCYRNK